MMKESIEVRRALAAWCGARYRLQQATTASESHAQAVMFARAVHGEGSLALAVTQERYAVAQHNYRGERVALDEALYRLHQAQEAYYQAWLQEGRPPFQRPSIELEPEEGGTNG